MSGAVDGPAVRSRKHRWLERILAFGGLAYWLLSAYLGLAFAAALLTTLTLSSVIRLYAELGVVVAAFGALIAHRWWPSAARFAHWAMLTLAVVMFGTCGELVELPPRYEAFDHRGVHVEFADDGVALEAPMIRDLIDQVYARSGLPQPDVPVRLRFIKNTGGRLLQLGDWRDAGAGGADVALTTDRGRTRGSSFLLEGSFLLTETLAQRAQPNAQNGARDGFAYWTMLGITPPPLWVSAQLNGTFRRSCADLAFASGTRAQPYPELTIWLGDAQKALRLNSWPFVDAERSGGLTAAQALFVRASALDGGSWLATLSQHCALGS